MKVMLTVLLVILGCDLFIGCKNSTEFENKDYEKAKQVEIKDAEGFNYLLFMPAVDREKFNGKYPLIIFLHGLGERGNDLQILKREGLPKLLDGDTNFPFMVISPQCPESTEWYYTNEDNVKTFELMISDAIIRFPIDSSRIYITGLSMGGIGTWYFTIKLPMLFAAMAPVAFRGDGWSPCPAKEIPAWAFHGMNDSVISLSKAEQIVNQFKDCGGHIEFTVYLNAGHDSWTTTYNNPDLYSWFLQHKKGIK